MGRLKTLTNGFIRENPTLVLVLGTCPTMAVSTMAVNGIGMGIAATFVLVCSNIVIAALKNIIPDKVRIPCYIVVIAGFVTIVELVIKAYAPAIDAALGIYIPLIVVNCIILGRAEMFANKNSVIDAALDGLGMGIGFTLALLAIGSAREILGAGTWMGIPIQRDLLEPIAIFGLPAGGFITYGTVIAIVNKVTKTDIATRRKRACVTCATCDMCNSCDLKEENA